MINILFLCHGNICRSPMAEFVMKHLVRQTGKENEFYIASAAVSREEIGSDTHHGTRKKLREMGIPFTPRAAVQVTPSDYDRYDYILLMDASNMRNIKRIIPNDPQNKIKLLLEYANRSGEDIADPWYTGNFDETYDDVLAGCTGLLKTIK
ncbi:MAG: low molecular weight phosphotyrosine protein phosphatase [Oscillospiraceae bacterium]|nr:low molecular weight phosphotyrosine protein phosphatase [Oscillospiraceae bacterium]